MELYLHSSIHLLGVVVISKQRDNFTFMQLSVYTPGFVQHIIMLAAYILPVDKQQLRHLNGHIVLNLLYVELRPGQCWEHLHFHDSGTEAV
jgi:hypothetical protein